MANAYRHQPPYPGSDEALQPWSASDELGYPGYGESGPPADNQKQIERVVDLIARGKWLILGAFLLVVAGTAIYTWTRTPRYQTRSYVLVDLGKPTLTMQERIEGSEMLFARTDRSISGEITLLQISDELASRVRERVSEVQARLREQRAADSTFEAPTTFEQLRGGIEFTVNRGSSNIIEMVGTSPDPIHASALANLYAEEYVQLTKAANRSYLAALRTELEKREVQRQQALDSIEARIQNYIVANGSVGLSRGAQSIISSIANLEADIEQARTELGLRQETLNELEADLAEAAAEPAGEVQVRDSEQTLLANQIDALEDQLTQLRLTRTQAILRDPSLRGNENDPKLQPINRQIAGLEEEIATLRDQYVAGLPETSEGTGRSERSVAELERRADSERLAIRGLEARIGTMQRRLASYNRDMGTIPEQSMELAKLERARMQAERMYEYITGRLQQARVAEEAEPGYAQILRAAPLPRTPVYPDPQRNMLLGGFLGLVLGLGLAVGRELLDSRIYKPGQLREHGYAELGVIPDLKGYIGEGKQGDPKQGDPKQRAGEQPLPVVTNEAGEGYALSLVTMHQPLSAAAEAYRHVRTNIQSMLTRGDVQVLLVTSPNMGEGKSVTTANLALSMAKAGKRVLLIDADLRRPTQHRLFDVGDAEGLAALLADDGAARPTTEAARELSPNLWVLPSGTDGLAAGGNSRGVGNTLEALGSARLIDLLEEARQHFDLVVIDSPPVLAATDAAVLSTLADGTLLVTRSGTTRRGELEAALDNLNGVNAHILGLVLNGFDPSKSYGSKYRYGYGHYGGAYAYTSS